MSDDHTDIVLCRLAGVEAVLERLIESHVDLQLEIEKRNKLIDELLADIGDIKADRDEADWWRTGGEPPGCDD